MEEAEVPTESIQEEILSEAEQSRERWISQVALSSTILAVFAAVASLLSGHHANEAMMDEIKSADKWAQYQAKGIKMAVLSMKMDFLSAGHHAIPDTDLKKMDKYKADQEEISAEAREKELGAEKHLNRHVTFARGVTLFQISIAVAAMSALLKRRKFWFVGLGFGVIGVYFLIEGLFF